MRISDWSSDVCSSDLEDAGLGLGRTVLARAEIEMEVVSQPDAVEVGVAVGHRRHRHPRGNAGQCVDGVGIVLDLVARFVERVVRSEEHTSELQSLMRISYAVFCLKKKN